ncbi:MAG: heme-binding protein [Gammaproteobacteria bacterium]
MDSDDLKRGTRGKHAAAALVVFGGLFSVSGPLLAQCESLPNFDALSGVLANVVTAGNNGGLGNNMWATIVDSSGAVCAVTRTGDLPGGQWLGSRVISAQKANTANAFSLNAGATGTPIALSTANLYAAVQPGGSLFGLQESNPVNASIAYEGDPASFGAAGDPLVGQRIGGINVFGGGLALYNEAGQLVGGLGVSGSTSCADHVIAWKVRDALGLDNIPGGVAADNTDNIIFDNVGTDGSFQSEGGFGHPECGFGETEIAQELPASNPIGPNEQPQPEPEQP